MTDAIPSWLHRQIDVGPEVPAKVLPFRDTRAERMSTDPIVLGENGEIVSNNPKRKYGIVKPSIQFMPPSAILAEAEVMSFGAGKYGKFNWRDKPVDASTYYSACFRHLAAWYEGEEKDPESTFLHLAHARACLGILIDAQATGNLIDDRPKRAAP